MTTLRNLPSIDQLLNAAEDLIQEYGRPLTVDSLRRTVDEARARLKLNLEAGTPSITILLAQAESTLRAWTQPTLQPVINATGVILHTNLGRAPLSKATIEAMISASMNYSNLEFDLETGKRGSRLLHAEALLKKITGAEAAIVVNNNASAVLLALSALANKKRVVISRSQLVEIGGGFRIPDVMKQSGAKLVEIGTTNKTRLSDYQSALQASASRPVNGLVMRAHRSNFKIIGFTAEPELEEIINAAHQAGVPFMDDLGSGALYDTAKYGFAHEPTVQESLQAGADIVCFSGDKLLGGPQAGIIVGKAELIAKIKKHPLARAVRADKICLAGLTATLLHYLKDEAEREIPIVRMMSMSLEQVKVKAEAWARELDQGSVIASQSTVGGGSLPDESIPTFALALRVKSPDKFLKKLRQASLPIIARTEHDQILLDPRTVLPEQENIFLNTLREVLHDYR